MTTPIGLNISQVFAKGFGISGNRREIRGKVYHKRKPNYYQNIYAACDPKFTRIVTSQKDIPYVKKQAAARFMVYSPCKKCFKQELSLTTVKNPAPKVSKKISIKWATGWNADVVNNFLQRKLGVVGFKCVSSHTGQLTLGQIYVRKSYNEHVHPCSNSAVHVAYDPTMARSFALKNAPTLYLAIMRPSYANTQVQISGWKDDPMDYKYYGQAYEIIGIIQGAPTRVTRKQVFNALKIKDV